MIRALAAIFLCAPGIALAQFVTPAHVIPARTVISASDLEMQQGNAAGVLRNVSRIVGKEARVTLYPGRPIMAGDIGQPAVVQRNQLVLLIYDKGALSITTEGRALARGGVGDRIPVMNLSSHATIRGVVSGAGQVKVSP